MNTAWMLFVICAGCNSAGTRPLPAPIPQPQKSCELAGAKLRELGCTTPQGVPLWQTPQGTPFSEACQRAASDGRNWHPHCIAHIRSCSELEDAYSGKVCLQ